MIMNNKAWESFNQHRRLKSDFDRLALEAEAFKSRLIFINKAQEALKLALEGDQLQHEELREFDGSSDDGVYQFCHYVLAADEDEHYAQQGANFVPTVIIGFTRAVEADNRPIGDQMFLVIPVSSDLVLSEDTTFDDIGHIQEVSVILSCPGKKTVADEYYCISENGVRPYENIMDNSAEQLAQIEQSFANIDVNNFLPASLNRPLLARLQDDLAEMIPMPLRISEIDLSRKF